MYYINGSAFYGKLYFNKFHKLNAYLRGIFYPSVLADFFSKINEKFRLNSVVGKLTEKVVGNIYFWFTSVQESTRAMKLKTNF